MMSKRRSKGKKKEDHIRDVLEEMREKIIGDVTWSIHGIAKPMREHNIIEDKEFEDINAKRDKMRGHFVIDYLKKQASEEKVITFCKILTENGSPDLAEYLEQRIKVRVYGQVDPDINKHVGSVMEASLRRGTMPDDDKGVIIEKTKNFAQVERNLWKDKLINLDKRYNNLMDNVSDFISRTKEKMEELSIQEDAPSNDTPLKNLIRYGDVILRTVVTLQRENRELQGRLDITTGGLAERCKTIAQLQKDLDEINLKMNDKDRLVNEQFMEIMKYRTQMEMMMEENRRLVDERDRLKDYSRQKEDEEEENMNEIRSELNAIRSDMSGMKKEICEMKKSQEQSRLQNRHQKFRSNDFSSKYNPN